MTNEQLKTLALIMFLAWVLHVSVRMWWGLLH